MHTCTFTGKIEQSICSWNIASESVFWCLSPWHVKLAPVTCQLNASLYNFLIHLAKLNSEPKKKCEQGKTDFFFLEKSLRA